MTDGVGEPGVRGPATTGAQADERALIERCKRGDRVAFDDLIRRYERRVYNFAYRLTHDHNDAEDVASETFVRIYNSIGNFRGDASFVTWLFRVVTNIYLDECKRRRARPQQSLEEMVELEESSVRRQVEDPSPTPAQVAEARERTAILRRAIATLPEYQRVMVVMYHQEGRSYEEIAASLDMPVGTVKSRLNRARLALRDRLAEFQEHFGR
jgi:RNA polymerase sigma-70 factor (ECF subfamily)